MYEVFTPPAICYDRATGAFRLASSQVIAEPSASASELRLIAVHRAPYRLQLAGYVGVPGDYLVAFVSAERPETLFGRVGRRFDELGITLKRFDLRKVSTKSPVAGEEVEIVAEALLQDERTGEDVLLDSRGATLTDVPVALIRGASGTLGEWRAGDTLAVDATTFRIERIELAPAAVVMEQVTPGSAYAERRVLRLPAAVPEEPRLPSPERSVGGPGQLIVDRRP